MTSDPYAIWISEVMLQQTRVETVIPYYKAFLASFPSVERLAAADPEEVVRAWSGLGYYRRARHLHAAAREIEERYGGRLPRNVDALRSLPGIGAYTSAAIASIAYGRPAAVVDGNVERVLSRLFRVGGDPGRAAFKNSIRSLASNLVDPDHPGDFNQALMELGASLCVPRSPECGVCPLSDLCWARANKAVERFPPKQKREVPKDEEHLAARVLHEGRTLFVRRPAGKYLSGFWELPSVVTPGPDAREEDRVGLLVRHLVESYGLRVELGKPGEPVRHSVMNLRIRARLVKGVVGDGEPDRASASIDAPSRDSGTGKRIGIAAARSEDPELIWAEEEHPERILLTTLTRKLLVGDSAP